MKKKKEQNSKQEIYLLIIIVLFLFILSSNLNNKNIEIINSDTKNYIQAPHINFEYEYLDNKLSVENVELIFGMGTSMQTSMFTGNILISKNITNINGLREGMIINYDIGNGITTHRISGIYPTFVIAQGDNSDLNERVNYENITSIVIGVLYR